MFVSFLFLLRARSCLDIPGVSLEPWITVILASRNCNSWVSILVWSPVHKSEGWLWVNFIMLEEDGLNPVRAHSIPDWQFFFFVLKVYNAFFPWALSNTPTFYLWEAWSIDRSAPFVMCTNFRYELCYLIYFLLCELGYVCIIIRYFNYKMFWILSHSLSDS